MVDLILGTVQLGLNYGINNVDGKPNTDEAFNILDYAFNNGINLLDTAQDYGESEIIIGNYMKKSGNYFNIATKLSSNKELTFKDHLTKSLENLSIDCIDIYLVHHFNDIIDNDSLICRLMKLKEENKIKQIGVSLYEPFELEYILNNHHDVIDIVQIPFNLLDSRWLSNNLLERTKEKNIKIFVRSIFIQGLIFLENKEDMDKIDSSLSYYINEINKISKELKVPISKLAMDYVKSFKEIDGILVGCENIFQLKENIELFKEENCLDKNTQKYLSEFTKQIPEKIIDPRKW